MRFATIPIVALCLLLCGCGDSAGSRSASGTGDAAGPTVASSSSPRPFPSTADPISVAVVGDSLTAGGSTSFSEGQYDGSTWVTQVLDDHVVIAGGWALGGATTALMRASVAPSDADVLVVMAGTNDVANGIPVTESIANIEAIVRIAGGRKVIISAIPPFDQRPTEAAAYNSAVREFSRAQGYAWVDPMQSFRNGDYYAAGTTTDGIHPTAGGQTEMARVLKTAIEHATD